MESATNLCLSMTVKAENCKVMEDIIDRIVINVVDLHRFPFDATDTTSSVGQEESFGCQFWGNGFSVLFRSHVDLAL